MVTDRINARQHDAIRTSQLTIGPAVPVTATPLVVTVAVGVATMVTGLGWAYGW